MVQSFRLSISSVPFAMLKISSLLIYFLFFSVEKFVREMISFRERAKLQKVHGVDKKPSCSGRTSLQSVCFSRLKCELHHWMGTLTRQPPALLWAPHFASSLQNLTLTKYKLFMYINLL